MVASSSVVKITAKTALKNKWGKSVAVSCAALFAWFLISLSASLIAVFSNDYIAVAYGVACTLFLNAPLLLGVLRCFWLLLTGNEFNTGDIFYYFCNKNSYKKSVDFTFKFILRAVAYNILFSIPAAVFGLLTDADFYKSINKSLPLWASNLDVVTVILEVLAMVLTFFTLAKYFIAPMLFVANDNYGVKEIFKISKRITSGNVIDFIYLIFSFLGWLVLSLLIIPLLFTAPYLICGYLVHCRFTVAQYNKRLEEMGNDSINFFDAG